ncbi:MAG: preprotein translocase subunit SecG [Myxococcota bacterium]|nr:preprotein translocase subunit SecG [Myxococcota bacterium]
MQLFVTTLHVILCFLLVLIILLQPGKGDASAMFGGGGGGNKKFGPRGAGNVLGKATTVVAILFMVTSITLALYSNESVREGSNIEDDILRIQEQLEQEKQAEVPPADPVPETELTPEEEPEAQPVDEDAPQ